MSCCCCGTIGTIVVVYFAIKLLLWVKLQFFTTTNLKKKYAKAGDWAVVTGASDGIGKAFCLELAKRGFNIVLIARTQATLDAVATQVQALGVKAITAPFDFSVATRHSYTKLFAVLDPLQVAILVNNVGVSYEYPELFELRDIDEDLAMIKVNIESQLQMTKYVVSKMKSARCGAIIDMSSISAEVGAPMLSTYAGSKAFNRHFSRSIRAELAPFNIDVIAMTPHFVISNMSKRRHEGWDTIAPSKFARSALSQLGSTASSAGHWKHALFMFVLSWVPQSFADGKTLQMHQVTKKKALAKKEREAKKGT